MALYLFSLLAYLTEAEVKTVHPVKETDFIIIDLRFAQNDKVFVIPHFAYVKEATKLTLRNHHYINKKCKEKCTTGFYVYFSLYL